MSMLSIESVSKVFPARGKRNAKPTVALQDVSLEVAQGEFCVIIGASGCGKSTLLRIIDGLSAPTSGRISLHGNEITGPGPDRAVVFQHAHLLPWRTALENAELGLEGKGVPREQRRERALSYLHLVGLDGFEHYYPAQLSGGMQQRVGLARAFAVEPELLLLDEPFGALDAQTRLVLQSELARIWSVERRTAVLITHDIEEAAFLADRVVVLGARPGRVTAIIENPLPAGRTDEVRVTSEFSQLKLELWDQLRLGMTKGA